jgi:5-methylcytosine-specific restriction endonuclease McrA
MKKSKVKFDKTDIYLKSAFRKIWRWSKARRECLKADVCNECGNRIPPKLRRADHIDPVISVHYGWEGWQVYYERMFNGKLQMMCKGCHDAKTKRENALRRLNEKRKPD